MNEIKPFMDETPLNFSADEKEKVVKKINEEICCLAFLRDLIKGDRAVVTNVWTTLGLNEGYHSDLSKMVGYDSLLAKEREERYAEIREKNEEIRKLTEQRGAEVTPEAVEGAIERYVDIFRAWYENEGFNYASIENMSAFGITADIGHDMKFREEPKFNDEIRNRIWSTSVGTEQKMTAGWDILKTQFHGELLDTDNNKKKMQELLQEAFPNMRIFKFTCRKNDYGGFSMNVEVNIPYKDLEQYYRQFDSEKLKGEK